MIEGKSKTILFLSLAFILVFLGFASACYCGDNICDETCSTCPNDCGICPPPTPVCGNHILETDEECDDGNLNDDDGCSYTCTIEHCGDWIRQDHEECDDGNNWNGDGCSSLCLVEHNPICGDGVKEGTEECDLGLLNGFLCWAGYGSSCNYCSYTCELITITNYCGDGILNSACEECDDGNTVDDDECSNECEINPLPPTCDHEIAVKYSYGDTFDTGIGISENNVWLDNPVTLTKDKTHSLKYKIDNKKDADDNVHITVKVDDVIFSEYDKLINEYHTKTLDLDITNLQCNAYHTISVEVESEGEECNTEDNYASRQFYVDCEEEPLDCDLTNAHWSTSTALTGSVVSLIVDGSNCEGKTINFKVYQYKTSGDAYITNTATATFLTGNSYVSSNWVAVAPSENDGDTTPTYYFIAEVLGSSEKDKSGNIDVTMRTPPTPVCGNNILETGEECDDGNLNNDDGCSSSCVVEHNDDDDENFNPNGFVQFCNTNWKCSGWSECSDGVMTRECFDKNKCEVEYNKPYEQTDCKLSKVYIEDNSNKFWIILGIIIFIVLLIILINLL